MPVDTSILTRLMQPEDPFARAQKRLQLQALMQQAQDRNVASSDMPAFLRLLQGKPAGPAFEVPANEMDQQGYQMAPTPAVEANPMAAYGMAAASRSPTMQRIGIQGMHDVSKERFKEAEEARKRKMITDALSRVKTPQEAIAAGLPVELVKTYFDEGLGKTKGVVINGQLVNPITAAKIGGAIPKQAAAPNLGTDLLIPGVDGKMVPNAPLIEAKKSISKAGASNVSMGVTIPGKKFYEGIGSGISEAVTKGYEQAQSGAQSLANANQIAASIDKAFIGPLANQRLTIARLGDVMGVAGKDNAERLENTRNLIQGLARQELAAAAQMKGQGQITESERAILRRAEAGEIQDFSKPELQSLVGSIRRLANTRIKIHQQNMEKLKIDPQAKELVDFMRVDVPQTQTPGAARFLGFE